MNVKKTCSFRILLVTVDEFRWQRKQTLHIASCFIFLPATVLLNDSTSLAAAQIYQIIYVDVSIFRVYSILKDGL